VNLCHRGRRSVGRYRGGERAGYRFFAAAFQFFRLDGQVFGSVSHAEPPPRNC